MDNEEQESSLQNEGAEKSQKDVTFPSVKPKKRFNKLLLVIPLILIIAGGVAYWLFFTEPSGGEIVSEVTPTPLVESQPSPTLVVINKEEVQIQILNGTGIPGEAALLKSRLEKLGYKNLETANADSKDYTSTVVMFPQGLDTQVVTEITNSLQEFYKDVQTNPSGSGGIIMITTGIRKGYTSPTPTKKAVVTTSVTPTLSPSITTSISPTKTPTPTPTQ